MISEPERAPAEAEAAEALASGADMDSVLGRLRDKGFSPMDCIRAVMKLTGSPLSDATRVVHFSSAWPELTER
ncbi:hypothetical protein OEIGOIKO_01284 [Streptomyces chrestomyceticus JCM 4735]|uniref:Uncharacterized protein n=3 Tax=Streptomyces TaxID=1883 RepID=A0A401VWS3_STREY|nr:MULTISPECIES: hypothetical protein [Streptomyces]GCD33563.1 hypothetical protein OEIGOIKO_01284 [Streptomyces chrestomyceticus JCM 4735]GCD41524.1 hypothetical protein GKJPGBOP_01179 [Streptomyces paromomycinus]